MPNRKNVWSSWNSILDKNDIKKNCITYWLNKLQNLKTEKNYFLTLNPFISINDNKIIKEASTVEASGLQAVDSGPNALMYGMKGYTGRNKDQAEKLGWIVIDYILDVPLDVISTGPSRYGNIIRNKQI